MNVVTRGMRNALRSPIRSGAIVLMLAISVGLIVAMLVAWTSVNAKIEEVKSSTANTITVTPAGIRGGFGGGDPLTSKQLAAIKSTDHIASTVSTLTDQAGTDDTNLKPSLELGSFGKRMQRFENSDSTNTNTQQDSMSGANDSSRPAPQARTTITGTTDPNSVSTDGSTLAIASGTTFESDSNDNVALVGNALAQKNSLKVGSTFTLYKKTFTVKGIFKTGNTFQDGGLIIPLATLQKLTDQTGAVTSVTAAVDSADNVASAVSALKSSLGNTADITSEAQRAEQSTESLASISSLALTGVIGATIAGAVILLLTMTMIVRERKREIGVIKAIGGTDLKVITQFISEALTLTVIGGVIGIAFGLLVSGNVTNGLVTSQSTSSTSASRSSSDQAGMRQGGVFGGPIAQRFNQSVQDVTSTVTPGVIGIAVSITLLIAVVGSALPAWLIARVRPAEVLRSE